MTIVRGKMLHEYTLTSGTMETVSIHGFVFSSLVHYKARISLRTAKSIGYCQENVLL